VKAVHSGEEGRGDKVSQKLTQNVTLVNKF